MDEHPPFDISFMLGCHPWISEREYVLAFFGVSHCSIYSGADEIVRIFPIPAVDVRSIHLYSTQTPFANISLPLSIDHPMDGSRRIRLSCIRVHDPEGDMDVEDGFEKTVACIITGWGDILFVSFSFFFFSWC